MAKKDSKGKSSSADDGKACALLSYFLVGIIWYFADDKMRENAFAKFHAKQALVLLITSVIFSVAASILVWIPILGWFVIMIVQLGILIVWIIGLINAASGKEAALPVIGQFAEKLTF